jgi:hypothetical protein
MAGRRLAARHRRPPPPAYRSLARGTRKKSALRGTAARRSPGRLGAARLRLLRARSPRWVLLSSAAAAAPVPTHDFGFGLRVCLVTVSRHGSGRAGRFDPSGAVGCRNCVTSQLLAPPPGDIIRRDEKRVIKTRDQEVPTLPQSTCPLMPSQHGVCLCTTCLTADRLTAPDPESLEVRS